MSSVDRMKKAGNETSHDSTEQMKGHGRKDANHSEVTQETAQDSRVLRVRKKAVSTGRKHGLGGQWSLLPSQEPGSVSLALTNNRRVILHETMRPTV